jgi:predicted metal-dependent peptidase
MPRVVTDQVATMGLRWNGQQVVLRVNPEWFRKGLAATQRKVALKHEVLHVVFRHLFRPGDHEARIYSIAADLVVNQLLDPLKPLPGWPTLEMFPELKLKPDQPLDVYYGALAMLLRQMQKAGFVEESGPFGEGEGSGQGKGRGKSGEAPDWAKATGKPASAKALAELLAGFGKRGDDGGWHDGQDRIGAAAGRYAVGSVLIRAKERMPPRQWDSLPAALLSELALILAERQPKLDWKRVVRIFCASSGCSKIRHTMKRVSKRYGTRPGIKVKRLQRLLVAVDTSGSIDQKMVEAFFTEIHAAWKAGATVHVVECDASVQRDYRYAGKPPQQVAGGGGTEFEPVFQWMLDQPPFDGCLYLTDGCGPAPTTRPRCKLLWVITGGGEDSEDRLPFGPTVHLPID